jgi:hypothetical protein
MTVAIPSQWHLVVAVVIIVSWCISCVEGPPPERNFEAEELLLDVSAFPQGWQAGEAGDLPGPIAGQAHEYERVTRGFTGRGLSRVGNRITAIQDVYRYGGTRTATRKFDEKRETLFKSGLFRSEWTIPEELNYQSSIADSFHLGCAFYSMAEACQALGQYEEYVIVILVDVYPDSDVTYSDFGRILEVMEEQIAFHLGSQ